MDPKESTAHSEALAHGLPAVATAVGNVRAIVEEGVNGFFVPLLDPAALAQATPPPLSAPALRERMGAESRRIARSRCRIDMHAAMHLAALEPATPPPTGMAVAPLTVGGS